MVTFWQGKPILLVENLDFSWGQPMVSEKLEVLPWKLESTPPIEL